MQCAAANDKKAAACRMNQVSRFKEKRKMIRKLWDHLEENILVASYLVVIPILFAQVICRYVFNQALTWSEELARYIFIWQIWLGSSYCVQKNRHIRIDIFTHKLNVNARKIFETLVTLVSIAFLVFLTVKGIKIVGMVSRMKQTSAALKLPMSYVYACIPVSCILMIIRYIEHIIKMFMGNEEKES